MKSNRITTTLFFITTIIFKSCAFAPVNNQYEKAGTLKKGNLDLSGNLTNYSAIAGGESAHSNTNFGFRVGYGISDKFDLKLRYERLVPSDAFDEDFDEGENLKGVNYFSLVPKVAIIPDQLSFLFPISRYSYKDEFDGQEVNNWFYSITPQIIYTLTNGKDKTDFSFGIKADCLFGGGGGGVLMGATAGAGFSSDLSKWAIRPEVGASVIGGGAFLSYGIGLQLIVPKNKKK